MKSTSRDEAYTPKKYIKSVIKVLETIDLDPASSEFGNSRIKATTFYSKEDDGLSKKWIGNIYLNPPYSTGNLIAFTIKLIAEFEVFKHVSQAIMLVKDDVSTKWFQKLMSRYLACLLDHRINFINLEGKYISSGADFGNVFFYLGENKERFAKVFSQYGTIVTRFQI